LPGQLSSVPEPWRSFLGAVDAAPDLITRLDCIGGFVLTMIYGMDRTTADVDVLEIAPLHSSEIIARLASQGGPLHRKHGVYLQYVGPGIAIVPENYEDRLTEMFAGAFPHLRIMALDPYDLALSKLERNIQRDRDNVRYLARTIPRSRPAAGAVQSGASLAVGTSRARGSDAGPSGSLPSAKTETSDPNGDLISDRRLPSRIVGDQFKVGITQFFGTPRQLGIAGYSRVCR